MLMVRATVFAQGHVSTTRIAGVSQLVQFALNYQLSWENLAVQTGRYLAT